MADKLRALRIRPGLVPEEIYLEDTLEALQKAVGGHLERIFPWRDPVALICNEEGKLRQLPLNRAILRDEEVEHGQPMIRRESQILDVIMGDFLVVGVEPPELCSLSDELFEKFYKRFQHPEIFIRIPGTNQILIDRVEIRL